MNGVGKKGRQEATSLDEILEIFAAQAVACGILACGILHPLQNDDNSPTRVVDLIRALQAFAILIEQRQSDINNSNNSSSNSNNISIDGVDELLAIESSATTLRQTSHNFIAFQRERLIEISEFSEELVSLCGRNKDYQSLILQSRSLLVAVRKQMFLEKLEIERVLNNLKDLYVREGDLVELCRDLEQSLETTHDVQSPQFRGVLSVMERWQRGKSKKASQGRSASKASKMLPPISNHDAKIRKLESNQPQDGSDGGVFSIEDMPCLKPFQFSRRENTAARIRKVLLVGKEGAGKTHICNEIELGAGDQARVHRLKIFGQTIGAMEDNIISFFKSAFSENSACLLLVDDLDEIIATVDSTKSAAIKDPTSERRESHSSARALATFLAMMDSTMASMQSRHHQNNVALICTAKINVNLSLARFDDVFVLESPNHEERKRALRGFVGLSETIMEHFSDHMRQQIELNLNDLATSTVGLSYAEISQNCRKARMTMDTSFDPATTASLDLSTSIALTLEAIKGALQSFAPSSLRSGVVDGYVDMRVLSSDDLLDPSRGTPDICPLYGHNSDLAWKELESQIVIPLCRSKELNLLLFNKEHSSVHGDLSGGVILTGAPGTGKSSLAQHCATFAASLLPSVKLLEVSCTSMIHKEVGGSEKAIHHLFDCARSAAPCVVILDDVAIISSVRGRDNTTEGTMDRVLSTLLTELDGVERDLPTSGDSAGIAVIGITQNVDWVDPALLRPGRLGKIVTLDAPDRETRRRIALRELEYSFGRDSKAKILEEVSKSCAELAELIADSTDGMAGANVMALCNDAKRSCITAFEAASAENLPSHEELITLMHGFIVNSNSTPIS